MLESFLAGYIEHFKEVLNEDELEYATNAYDGMEEALKKDCFEVFKKAVIKLNMCNKEFAGIYVSRKFSMFSNYMHEEWSKVHTNADDIEFRTMLSEYTSVVTAVDVEGEERKQYVKKQEEGIMERIKEEYDSTEER
jgi:hypothetical protein